MTYSIDRFEGKYAVLIGEQEQRLVLRSELPEGACEGMRITQLEDGWRCKIDETIDCRLRLSARRKKLMEKKP